MKTEHNIGFTLLFFYISILPLSYSQTSLQENTYYNSFDKIIDKKNTSLFNGVLYLNRYRTINENHQFFKGSKFKNGVVYYDSQVFFDEQIQYDVYSDDVLIKLKRNYAEVVLKLIKEKVEGFIIDDHRFIKINPDKELEKSIDGFHEVLLETATFSLFKKYLKNRERRARNRFVYYDFLDKHHYVIYYNNSYQVIKSKSDLSKIFPEFKKEVANFYNSSRTIKKSNPDLFYQSLLKKIDLLLLKKNN
ncbi:hypothetical protein [Aquimarina sp. RZ0]|uniref:hypothetical protein n=1 Tax=Aquimarina sp. RZ0 TaxID=2607730 RepID=UPI0011F10289|nr:hypothetical protein [Aquimarina sp. RZ0]KAA1246782.1 hypothetical protein F0000_05845 [Aquimarina sp. RZ0]